MERIVLDSQILNETLQSLTEEGLEKAKIEKMKEWYNKEGIKIATSSS